MRVQFDETTHTYTSDTLGVLPSVTTILSAMNTMDTSFFSPESAERGTMIHNACELVDQDALDIDSLDDDLRPRVEAYINFLRESKFEVLFSEIALASVYGFAGKPDRVGMLNGRVALLDIKSGIHAPAHCLQTVAYAHLVKENFPDFKYIDRYCLYLSGEGKFSLVAHQDSMDRATWLAVLSIYQWLKKNNLIKER